MAPRLPIQRISASVFLFFNLVASLLKRWGNRARRTAACLICSTAPARAHGRLVPDKIYPGMWRVVGPSGTLSDIVNETRAKDVAWCLAESMVSTGTLAA